MVERFRVPSGTAQTPLAQSIPQFKSMPLQQQLELCSRVYLLMVLFLACNVLPHGRHLGSADAAREISYLPAQSDPRMVGHPSRGICLQHLHGLRNAESCSHINEGVYVVLNAIDRDCVHVMFF